MNFQTTYDRWQAGDITAQQALEEMAASLNSLQDSLGPLQETEKVLRNHLSEVVDHLGGNVELPGFGKMVITGATTTVSYDSKALDKLVARLVSEGYQGLAQDITNCRKESSRSGGLRITRDKEK